MIECTECGEELRDGRKTALCNWCLESDEELGDLEDQLDRALNSSPTGGTDNG